MKLTKEASKIILEEIISALHEKGYEPYEQIYGYLKTGLETYITRYDGARDKIKTLDENILWEYIQNNSQEF